MVSAGTICISVVSHGQGELVTELLRSLSYHCQATPISLVITKNIPEPLDLDALNTPFPCTLISNHAPKGYGANHNAAFQRSSDAQYFCVLNPDILFSSNPFPSLLAVLEDQSIGLVGPALVDSDGSLQDSARQFPTLWRIFLRRICGVPGGYPVHLRKIIFPDWIAGMFMLIPTTTYALIQGFDERYYMYCEDADLCRRLRQQGLKTAYLPATVVIHNPRRNSHRDLQHLKWHLGSLTRFIFSRTRKNTHD